MKEQPRTYEESYGYPSNGQASYPRYSPVFEAQNTGPKHIPIREKYLIPDFANMIAGKKSDNSSG